MRITLSFIYLLKKSLLLFITFFVLIFAQDNRLRLKQADLLENITIDGISMQYLKGDVIFCATGVTDGDLVKGIKNKILESGKLRKLIIVVFINRKNIKKTMVKMVLRPMERIKRFIAFLSSEAIGIAISYLKVITIEIIAEIDITRARLPNAPGVNSLIRIGEKPRKIKWPRPVPEVITATSEAKVPLVNIL